MFAIIVRFHFNFARHASLKKNSQINFVELVTV